MFGIGWRVKVLKLPMTVPLVLLVACGEDRSFEPPPDVPTTGTIRVSTTSSGHDVDYTGYTVRLDDAETQRIDSNGELVLGPVSAGTHAVAITDVAHNCTVAGGETRTVEVVAGQEAEVDVRVECESLGDLAIGSSGDILLIFSDAPGANRVTEGPAIDRLPRWSPDGSAIAFMTDRDGNDEIYLARADGSGLINLTEDPASDRLEGWSPDGSAIAFVSDRSGTDQIYWLDVASGQVTHVSRNDLRNRSVAWSPDGAWLAYGAETEPIDDTWELTVARPDGSGQSALYTTEFLYEVDWSPDGTRLYLRDDYSFKAIGVDGTHLASFGNDCNAFSVSPLGDRILVLVDSGLWILDARIVDRRFQNPVFLWDYDGPALPGDWSPDGREVLVIADWPAYALHIATVATIDTENPREIWNWGPWPNMGGASWRPD